MLLPSNESIAGILIVSARSSRHITCDVQPIIDVLIKATSLPMLVEEVCYGRRPANYTINTSLASAVR